MDSPINRIDELLSGMLDGVLSEADSRELGRAMAKDPSLEMRLDELAAVRKALMSGRSTQTLRPDFAGFVTLAAKKRASELDGSVPEWLLSDADSAKPSKKSSAPSIFVLGSRSWIFAGALSLAALLAFFFFPFPKPAPQGVVFVPDVSNPEQELVVSDPSPELPRPERGSADELLNGKIDASIARSEQSLRIFESPEEIKTAETGLPSAEDRTTIEEPIVSPVMDAANINVIAKSSPKELQSPTENETKSKKPFYMVVLDISLDQQTVEERVLERILEKYGIVYTDDLVLNDEQIQNLEKSQWVGNPNVIKQNVGDLEIPKQELANSKNSGTEEKMGVLFLRSTAKKLGSAVQEIVDDSVSFPDFGLDMVMGDEPARLLVDQLSTVQVAESAGGFAGRLFHPASRKDPSPFTATSSRKRMSDASRGKFKGAMVSMLPDHEAMSNILILLRPAKK